MGAKDLAEKSLVEESGFRLSIIERGRKRLGDVWQVAEQKWVLRGRPELGDVYGSYTVVLVRDGDTFAVVIGQDLVAEEEERFVATA